jgi:hypothetical protein
MPRNLSVCNAKQFLDEVEHIFALPGSKEVGVELDTSQTDKADIFGQLLLYKFIEYTIHQGCFKNPSTNLKNNAKLKNLLDITGFLPFVNEFMNKKNNILKNDIPEEYKLEWKEADKFYIAPIVLSKTNDYSEKEDLIRKKIREYYNYDSTIVSTIMSCISEIGSNFLEHAEDTTNSVMVAAGNREYFELACADTGKGVLSSLRAVVNGRMQKHELLRQALNKGVTSKPGTNHLGAGLWLISQYVSFSGGELLLLSEGALCHQKKSNFKMGQCGYWKGTIIYVRMSLLHKEAIAAGKVELKKQYNHVKLALV